MEYPDEERITEYDMIMLTGSGRYFCDRSGTERSANCLVCLLAASAYENLEWINRLIEFVQHVAKDYPKVKICGKLTILNQRPSSSPANSAI